MLNYAIRENRRARRVLLKADPHLGLIVVVPRGYDRALVPGVLLQHADWIRAALASLPAEGQADLLPATVELAGGREILPVAYRPTAAATVSVRETAGELRISGPVHDPSACRRALRRWLLRRARRELPPLLESLSCETGLALSGWSIRLQRSRWGSCSPKGKISLNGSLLFLPPHLVRYVLVHELCHTRFLDHSPRFWALVGHHEALYRESRRELSSLRGVVPAWVYERPLPKEVGALRLL